MAHSVFTAAFASIGAVANTLMQIQGRAEAYRSGSIDPRYLPEHLRRDIGLADGRVFGEQSPDSHTQSREASARWTDYIQTPHAA